MEKLIHKDPSAGIDENYQRTKMQEEMIFQKLKNMGCRITKQRQILLSIILQEECASCKEIYYKARKEDGKIGAATVYRTINLLEEIGAISRKNMYRIPDTDANIKENKEAPDDKKISQCQKQEEEEIVCIIEMDDHTVCRLLAGEWYLVMTKGLKVCGYIKQQKIVSIRMAPHNLIERNSQQEKNDRKQRSDTL